MSSCSDVHDVNGCNSIQVGRPVIYNHHQLIAITDLSPNRGVAVALRVGKPARGYNSQLTSLTVPPYTSLPPYTPSVIQTPPRTRINGYKMVALYRRTDGRTVTKWIEIRRDSRTCGLQGFRVQRACTESCQRGLSHRTLN